jgi:hypothetical protein
MLNAPVVPSNTPATPVAAIAPCAHAEPVRPVVLLSFNAPYNHRVWGDIKRALLHLNVFADSMAARYGVDVQYSGAPHRAFAVRTFRGHVEQEVLVEIGALWLQRTGIAFGEDEARRQAEMCDPDRVGVARRREPSPEALRERANLAAALGEAAAVNADAVEA